jgi:YVTN family beta-propeller protein
MKSTTFFRWAVCCSLFAGVFSSCNEKDDEIPFNPVSKGVFVLNEGSFGSNNSGVSFYDEATGRVFFDLLEQKAGDTGQDLLLYGSKLYVVFSGSGYVSVIDPETKREMKKIPVQKNNQSRNPRYLDAHGGKLFVSTFDGYLLRIDTVTLEIDGSVATGPNPEGVVYANGKIYVANSDGLNSDNGCVNGKTVSVIDATTFTKETDLAVRANPYYLRADSDGNIYVSIRAIWKMNADYSFSMTAPACFQRIDAATNDTTTLSDLSILKFYIDGNDCYYFTGDMRIGILDLKSHVSRNFITDATVVAGVYGLGIDAVRKKVYVADTDYSNPGVVHIYDFAGRKETSFDAGMNPSGFAFYR